MEVEIVADDASVHTNSGQSTQQTVQVRYEQTDTKYASQFVVNATNEEVIVNFSAGYISDPNSQQVMLPIHGRIAMSFGGCCSPCFHLESGATQRKEGAGGWRAGIQLWAGRRASEYSAH